LEFTCKGLSKYVVSFKFIILLAVITIKSKTSELQNFQRTQAPGEKCYQYEYCRIAIPKCIYSVDGGGASSGGDFCGGCGAGGGGGRVLLVA
jgi:hypothetical protein